VLFEVGTDLTPTRFGRKRFWQSAAFWNLYRLEFQRLTSLQNPTVTSPWNGTDHHGERFP